MTDFKLASELINEADAENSNHIRKSNEEGTSHYDHQTRNQPRLSVLRVFDPLFSKSPVQINQTENVNIQTELNAGDELSDGSDSEYVDAVLHNNSSVCSIETLIDCTVDCFESPAVDSAEEFCSSFSEKCDAANIEEHVDFHGNYTLDIDKVNSTFVVEAENSSSDQVVGDLTNASVTDVKERNNSSLPISFIDLTNLTSDCTDEELSKDESAADVTGSSTADLHSEETIEIIKSDIDDSDLNKTNDGVSFELNNCSKVVDFDHSTNKIVVEATLKDTELIQNTNSSLTNVLEIESSINSQETTVLEDNINEVSLIRDHECSKNIKNTSINCDIQSCYNGESNHQVVEKLRLSDSFNNQEIQVDRDIKSTVSDLNISTENSEFSTDYRKSLTLDNGDHENFEAVGLDKILSNSELRHNYRVIMDKFALQQQEISDLKLQLNASQQAKTTLELEIRQKEEIVIKTQAEILRQEQAYLQDIKTLKEQLLEKTKQFENGSAKALEQELKLVKQREAEALTELNARYNDELNFKKIMNEYETTLSAKVVEFEKLKDEHETALKHLANLEFAFSDIHQKYERSKSIIEGFKTNEETLRNQLHVLQETLQQQEEKYEFLKAHAKAQIEKSNKDMHVLTERNDSEVSKLNAVIKRMEIKLQSLETTLEHKNNECKALAELCDQVTGKKV